jgi:hypothetical protein
MELFSEQQSMGLRRSLVHHNGWLGAANWRVEALGHEESSSCVAQGFSPVYGVIF